MNTATGKKLHKKDIRYMEGFSSFMQNGKEK
jgi:hypothetical protein